MPPALGVQVPGSTVRPCARSVGWERRSSLCSHSRGDGSWLREGPWAWRSGPASWWSRTTRPSRNSPGGRWCGSSVRGSMLRRSRSGSTRTGPDAADTLATPGMVGSTCALCSSTKCPAGTCSTRWATSGSTRTFRTRDANSSSTSAACPHGTHQPTRGKSAAMSKPLRRWRGRSGIGSSALRSSTTNRLSSPPRSSS